MAVSVVQEYTNSRSFKKETKGSPHGKPYPDKLTLTTFNANLLPCAIDNVQRVGLTAVSTVRAIGSFLTGKAASPQPAILGPSLERAKEIGKKLAECNHDFYCGQDVFDTASGTVIADSLKDTHEVLYNISAGSKANSGLFFASRYPIQEEEVRYWRFTDLTGEDSWSDKGMIRVSVTIPFMIGSDMEKKTVDKELIIYNVHTQASSGQPYAAARIDETQAILKIIQDDYAANHSPIILSGDLNISNFESDGSMPQEYDNLQASFFNFFYDLYLQDHDTNGNRNRGEQVHTGPLPEPKGSYYDMSKLGSGVALDKVRYSYSLLYITSAQEYLNAHTEFLRIMEPNLAKHLPMMTIFGKEIFSLYS